MLVIENFQLYMNKLNIFFIFKLLFATFSVFFCIRKGKSLWIVNFLEIVEINCVRMLQISCF